MGISKLLGFAVLLVSSSSLADPIFKSSAGDLQVETVATGLVHPWSLAFLPDDRMLVTERPGQMRVVSGSALSPPVTGIPAVVAKGQAGLMDVILDRRHQENGTIYFCFNENADGDVAIARARLIDGTAPKLDNLAIVFRQNGPPSVNGANVACRLAQGADGRIFAALGDHADAPDAAQDLGNTVGKIIRIEPDGAIPPDNPFVNVAGAKAEIWAYGVRNPQGLTFDSNGTLWEQEHGPQGGDEINVIAKGKNYGWPVIGYGVKYGGAKMHETTRKEGMEQPVWHWTPSIAPSGMAFYRGNLFRRWSGSLLNGALGYRILSRLQIVAGTVREERLLGGLGERIRDVRIGPEGAIYLLTDNPNGRILRIVPARRQQ